MKHVFRTIVFSTLFAFTAVALPAATLAVPATTGESETLPSINLPGGPKDDPARAESARALEIYNSLPPDIQKKIADEAQDAYTTCAGKSVYSAYVSCGCLGPAFMEQRVLHPEMGKTLIMDNLAKRCPNVPGIAGLALDSCHTFTKTDDPNREKLCTCVANATAREYARNPVAHTEAYQIYLSRAYSQCNTATP